MPLRRVPFCREGRKFRALPQRECQNYQQVYRSTGLKPFLTLYGRFSALTKRLPFYTFKSLRASSVLYDKLFRTARCASLEKPLKLSACRASARALPNALRELAGEKTTKQMYREAVHMYQTVASAIRRWIAYHVVKESSEWFSAALRPQTSAFLDVKRSRSGLSVAHKPSNRIAPGGKESTPQLQIVI